MSLFTPEEIGSIRDSGPPVEFTEHGQAAFQFLRSETLAGLATDDQHHRAEPKAQEMRLALVSRWSELDRASRALQHIDRELRRCARAWTTAYDLSSAVADETVFETPAPFLAELETYPHPVHVGRGHLTVKAAAAVPEPAFLVEPAAEVFAVLAEWPKTSLGYALSVFGTTGEMNTYRDLDIPPTAAETAHLDALLGDVRAMDPARPQAYAEQRQLKHHRTGFRRAIAESHDEDRRRTSGVHVVLHRVLADGSSDVTAAWVA